MIHRVELLAELMAGRRGLAVAGAHGKSTTSAMLALALGARRRASGRPCPVVAGTGAVWGEGPWFVAEADESDRSLLDLAPEAAILLNVDHDHHTTYASIEEVEDVFASSSGAFPAEGLLVVGPDRAAREAVAEAARCAVRVVGDGADCRVEPDPGRLVVRRRPGRVRSGSPCRDGTTCDNAACAMLLADWCGVAPGSPRPPARRVYRRRAAVRAARRGRRGCAVVDDYAHHPAEIAATSRRRGRATTGRIVVIFQPHLYSRTKALLPEFGEALSAADWWSSPRSTPRAKLSTRRSRGRDVAEAMRPRPRRFAAAVSTTPGPLEPELRPAISCSPSAPATSRGWGRS